MSEQQPIPKIVHGAEVPAIAVDAASEAATMRELGIPDQVITNTTIYMDPKNRFLNNGTHYFGRLQHLRFLFNPKMREANGHTVRITTVKRGEPRTEEQMNHTKVHELEHIAQDERNDIRVPAGHAMIGGFAIAGAVAGNQLGWNKRSKNVMATVGAVLGYEVGYMLAPHERQARKRAKEVTSTAIRRLHD